MLIGFGRPERIWGEGDRKYGKDAGIRECTTEAGNQESNNNNLCVQGLGYSGCVYIV